MAKSFLTGTIGFIFFGASSYILSLLIILFPINIIDNIILFITFNAQTKSTTTAFLLSLWNILWIFLIGTGFISARKQTKTVYFPIILSYIAIITIFISSIMSIAFFQSKTDIFKSTFFFITFLRSSLWDGYLGSIILTPLLSGGSFAQNFAIILNLISELSVAVFFVAIAISFFLIENRSFKSGYKVIAGIFTLIYGILQIFFGFISLFTMSGGSFGSSGGVLSLFLIILSGLQTVLFYLLPIFGSMLFVLINLDNP